MKKLNLNAIRIDGGTQARVSLNEATVAEYAECLEELPPVVVFFDGADNWLADGFHRLHAYRKAGKASIPADIRTGTQRDAILYSLGAMLADDEWSQWSDRKIADACGVSHTFVALVRTPPEVATVATRKAAEGGNVATNQERKVATVATPKATDAGNVSTGKTQQKPETPADADQLTEAQHTITELADENEQLRDRLAVESLMDSEEAKTQTAETIRELRALVKTLEAENAALKVSRDTYQREASEAKKSAIYWRKQAEKAAKDAA